MRVTFNILIFSISGILFGQNNDGINSNVTDLISSAECLTTTFFLGNKENLMVALLNEHIITSDINPEHYYFKSSKEKNIDFINLLLDNSILDEIYVINYKENGGYRNINNDEIVDGNNVELFIQIDFDSPCHNDTLFVLIKDINIAKKITSELAKLFNENAGFEILNARIKT